MAKTNFSLVDMYMYTKTAQFRRRNGLNEAAIMQYRNWETIDERVDMGMGARHNIDRKKGKWTTLPTLSADY